MSVEEGELYLKSQAGIPQKSFAIRPEDFDRNAGHNINRFLEQNAALKSRKQALVDICNDILRKDATTKIIVFADASVGGGFAAKEALNGQGGPGCTSLDECDSPETQNIKISWYQHGDATEADRKRPRVLVLHFEQAAGLNLQSECYNMIFFTPLYRGDGGATSDPVADVSSELQAVGRVSFSVCFDAVHDSRQRVSIAYEYYFYFSHLFPTRPISHQNAGLSPWSAAPKGVRLSNCCRGSRRRRVS